MGWVVEQAGGRASTGVGAMLDQEVRPLRALFHVAGVGCARTLKTDKLRSTI